MKRLVSIFVSLVCLAAGTASDPKPILVGVNQEFKIALESDPSTGNQWLMARPLNENLLKLLGSEFKRGRANASGSAGSEILRFKALSDGKTQIYLKYSRLWQGDAVAALSTNFVVVITNAVASLR
jgi:predicted secreted protein